MLYPLSYEGDTRRPGKPLHCTFTCSARAQVLLGRRNITRAGRANHARGTSATSNLNGQEDLAWTDAGRYAVADAA